MALTKTDRSTIEKARAGGAADLAVTLDDAACAGLLAIICGDLGLNFGPEVPDVPSFFEAEPNAIRLSGLPFWPLMERVCERERETVTYFACLAKLHKARLKYARILRTQAIPTMDQVGPRGLLQFGIMTPRALTCLLLWRKWVYDLDNRAAQETGYVFEPIIAHSIGGAPWPSKRSPVRRHDDPKKGRQVDCIAKERAYEFKLRVTIAASGQGRWKEELQFPLDARQSGYQPMLVVFDPTRANKLDELRAAFEAQGGVALVGNDAWAHLTEQSGPTMAVFLRKYVREPIDALLAAMPVDGALDEMTVSMSGKERIVFSIGGEEFAILREPPDMQEESPADGVPDDIDETTPGP